MKCFKLCNKSTADASHSYPGVGANLVALMRQPVILGNYSFYFFKSKSGFPTDRLLIISGIRRGGGGVAHVFLF